MATTVYHEREIASPPLTVRNNCSAVVPAVNEHDIIYLKGTIALDIVQNFPPIAAIL